MFQNQVHELKNVYKSNNGELQKTLLDPAVNVMFEDMRQEVQRARNRVDEMQSELSAWKFTPDSNTGKRLMGKCRLLYQENEELGRVVSSGRIAKLEGDLALQKSFSDEMKKSQAELDEFLFELDEDVEGMQSTIYYLQQQLRDSREQISQLQKDNEQLKATSIEISVAKSPPENESCTMESESIEPSLVNVHKVQQERINLKVENEIELPDIPELTSSSFSANDDTSTKPISLTQSNDEQQSLDRTTNSLNESQEDSCRKRLCDLTPDIGGGIDSIIRKHRRLEIKAEPTD